MILVALGYLEVVVKYLGFPNGCIIGKQYL